MRILDRYILKSVAGIFIVCVFSFLFLYVIIDMLSHLEDILKNHVGYALLLKYYLANLPIMFVQVSPFACLLATVYTFSRLNHSNEVIAMRSSGMSVFTIGKAVIIFGILVSMFVFWLNHRVLPHSLAVTQRIKSQIEDGTKKSQEKKQEVIRNLAVYGLRNRLFFVNKFISATNTLEGIIILEQDEHQNITKKIVANKGVFSEGVWKFYQSISYNFGPEGQVNGEPQYYEEEIMAIPETPEDFVSQRQRPELMTLSQMDDYIWKLSHSGAKSVLRNLKIDYYLRFTSCLTNFIIILLGIPFSLLVRKRSSGLSSVGLSIMVGFLYYILDAVCIAFGRGGYLFPLLSASLSHIIAFCLSLYFIASLP